MSRYPLNLPSELKKEAESWAERQGVSLNQFTLWSVAEKVGELRQTLDDPNFPGITYRKGASGQPVPVLRGKGIRVRTVVEACHAWRMSPTEIAQEYELEEARVRECLAFHEAHRAEIDASLQAEEVLEKEHDQSATPP